MGITVRKVDERSQLAQKQIAEIVLDAYWEQISLLCSNRAKMIEAMQTGYNAEFFYIAYDGEDAVGVAACSPPGSRAVTVDPEYICRVLGNELGPMASEIMKSEFGTPLDFGPDSSYIEFVGTVKIAQGKGVASAITKAILETTPYKRLVLEVVDTNTAAIRLYTKFGFKEFERKAEENPEQTGISYRIYMEYIR